MRRTSTLIREYLSRLLTERQERWHTLRAAQFDRHRRPEVPNSILETWTISMHQIRLGNEKAYKVLHILAYLDNQDIPIELIKAASTYGDDDTTGEPWEVREVVENIVIRLKEFSFLGQLQIKGG